MWEGRITPQTGVVPRSPSRTAKVKIMVPNISLVAPVTAEYNCIFCRKGKHSTENCRARKKAEREAPVLVTVNATSNASHVLTGQPTVHSGPSLPTTAVQMPQIPSNLTKYGGTPTTYRSEATANEYGCWHKWCIDPVTWVTTIVGATHTYSSTGHGCNQEPSL